jgi:hypothetical protein
MLSWLPLIDENTSGKSRRSALIIFRGGMMVLEKHLRASRRGGFSILSGGGGSPMPSIKAADFAPRRQESRAAGIAVLYLCLLFIVVTPAWPQATFTTIDVQGAGTGALQGTLGVSINANGDIAGIYLVGGNVAHGFVRAADGTTTKFDAPNAGSGANQGTFPLSINSGGDIAGMYFDTNNVYHGFVRDADGTITEFNVPGAGTVGHRGTEPISINAAGDITGIYTTNNPLRHGFVRAASGTITTFDVTGAGKTGSAQGQGTQPLSINAAGDIAGFYVAANGGFHGFIRAADGTITAPIDVPGAGTSGGTEHHGSVVGTLPLSIDAAGDTTGIYTDASQVDHAFVRAADGTMTYPIDAPGVATSGPVFLPTTLAASINTEGVITGTYEDSSGVFHVFVRAANGSITAPINAPGAGTAGTSPFPGTLSVSINDLGDITGTYADASGVFHGYVATFAVTPQGQVTNLQNGVEDLVSAGTLSPAQGQFLLAPLNAALTALGAAGISTNRGQTTAAIRDLEEFIGRVRVLTLSGQLSRTVGGALIDVAESIIRTLRN